ncbi:hypothetical protein GCM10011506_09040 [Marivirga lumbricoides]|uniref:HTH cro/C1-type domain-containing protein n=1 Tax=Marivirga lumbricoides TaxID=1046115 RepID=A0ABQ1LP36_9BACT|nr:hypothetical protein GCM10011506_09040 [Marivirga lumbricoides]
MRQPKLGKKIAELRKTKRLTQEELVEKCNISIRTIQRIEAGEVSPRDYTVKTILNALDYDWDQVSKEKEENVESNWSLNILRISANKPINYYIKQIKIAWVSGILFFIIRFLEGAVEYSRIVDRSLFDPLSYILVKIAIVLAAVFFFRGFVVIGSLVGNQLLKMISAVSISLYLIIIGLDVFSILTGLIPTDFMVLLYSVSFGLCGLIFGFSLIKLRSQFGRLAKLAGILEILAACLSLSIILAFISPIILIPAEILEVIVIYRVIEFFNNNEKAEEYL